MEPDVSFSPMKLSSDGSGRVGTLSYQSELPTHFSSRDALVSWLCEKKTWASFRCVANGSVRAFKSSIIRRVAFRLGC